MKEVHKDSEDSPYVFPESYKNQINYTRGQRQLNKPNPGDTKFLEKTNIDTALKISSSLSFDIKTKASVPRIIF